MPALTPRVSAIGSPQVEFRQQLFSGKLLLVEDDATNQLVARAMLEKLGCELEIANHGQEALERLQRSDVDLVMMDCQMPTMDGYETTRRIRAGQARLSNIDLPIIAMMQTHLENLPIASD